jgi:hypothetical protein
VPVASAEALRAFGRPPIPPRTARPVRSAARRDRRLGPIGCRCAVGRPRTAHGATDGRVLGGRGSFRIRGGPVGTENPHDEGRGGSRNSSLDELAPDLATKASLMDGESEERLLGVLTSARLMLTTYDLFFTERRIIAAKASSALPAVLFFGVAGLALAPKNPEARLGRYAG